MQYKEWECYFCHGKINDCSKDNVACTPALFKNSNIMEEEIGMIEIDSEIIGQDLDDIDPYAEFTVEEENDDDCNILFE